MNELLKECDEYFKQEGFTSLFVQMRTKYESLGYLGGTILLSNLSDIEKHTLNGFLRVDLSYKESIRVSIKKIKKLLQDTKFAEIELETILFHYFKDDEILSKRHKQDLYYKHQHAFFNSIFSSFQDTLVSSWITFMEKEGIPLLILRRYETDKLRLEQELSFVFTALNTLPIHQNKKKHMPIFASEITGNPHAFDESGSMFPLLIQGICYVLDIPYTTNMDAETKMNVLYEAGILKDDISSFAITYGFYAFHEEHELQGWRNFKQQKEPLLISLANLYNITEIKTENFVYVVENPSVFSALLMFCKEQALEDVSIMCTYGQLRVASIQILDMIVKNNQSFRYAGDFDPEGLQIAQKLCQRYGQSCSLWHYKKSDYELALSNEQTGISRLQKLESIIDPRLDTIKACLKEKKCNAYQEHLISIYQEDIRKASMQE